MFYGLVHCQFTYFLGTFFMMCHKHQQCLVLGNTTTIAFFMALHWSVMMPSGALLPMHLNQHWNSHVKVDASSTESSPHPSRIEWPWWLTPTKGVNDMLYLLVRYVVSNDMTSPKSTNADEGLSCFLLELWIWWSCLRRLFENSHWTLR